jgi:hypothetical protein
MRSPKYAYVACAGILLALAGCGGRSDSATPAPQFAPQLFASAGQDTATITYTGLVQALYVSYFGRPADSGGLASFSHQLADLGVGPNVQALMEAYARDVRVRNLVDSFGNSAESAALYGGSEKNFVTAVYLNLLGREPDEAGLAFWVGAIVNGRLSRSRAALDIYAGALSNKSAQGLLDAALITKKTQVAEAFTIEMVSTAAVGYSGEAAAARANNLLSSVQATTDASSVSAAISSAIKDIGMLGTSVEIPGKPVKIALIVTSAQNSANGARIQRFADALSSDLNKRAFARSGPLGASHSVEILIAGGTASAVRNQLKPYDSAMLIGQVPVPLITDFWDNFRIKPLLDPLRLPACEAYSFNADGNTVGPSPQTISTVPSCRNGMALSVLRGLSPTSDEADVAKKLDQFIDYHQNSDLRNQTWSATFQDIWALWMGSLPYYTSDNLTSLWSLVTLNAPLKTYSLPSFITSGTAIERKRSFESCLARKGEMCTVAGHGDPTSILFEGPSALGQYYSSDSVTLMASDIKPNSVNAKYVRMMSCSSQNFVQANSMATTLLMAGDTMLTYGASTTAWGGQGQVMRESQQIYPYLALGSTYAEAARGTMGADSTAMQGDPYISFRPVPLVAPKLLINGKHYNDGNFIMPVVFPESVNGAASFFNLMLTNGGKVDLHVQFSWAAGEWSLDNKPIPEGGFNGGLSQLSPAPLDFYLASVQPYGQGIGNIIYTIKPAESLRVTYKFTPWIYDKATTYVTGTMGSTLQMFSDDPASFKVTLDASMKVK